MRIEAFWTVSKQDVGWVAPEWVYQVTLMSPYIASSSSIACQVVLNLAYSTKFARVEALPSQKCTENPRKCLEIFSKSSVFLQSVGKGAALVLCLHLGHFDRSPGARGGF